MGSGVRFKCLKEEDMEIRVIKEGRRKGTVEGGRGNRERVE